MNSKKIIQSKLDLLREALPYIQKFKGKTFVVKFSGKVTEDKENKLILLSDVNGIYLASMDETTKISRISAPEAEQLIENGIASGGMIPKL